MKKTIKDIMYNAVYQVFLIILPLLTTPILSRRIGSEGLGIYGYVFSIAQFLITVIAIGMSPFRIRNIAKVKNDREKLTSQFWNLYAMQFLIGLISILFYVAVIWIFQVKYASLYLIQLLFIIGVTLDISWFFQGIEEFAKVVVRNTLIKITSVVLIILLINNQEDLWLYIFITSAVNLVGSLVFWVGIHKKVGKIQFDRKIFASMWKPGLFILIPQLFMQVYTTLDKTVVGQFVDPTELSYYDQSQKIARIILALLTSVTIVMLPKMSKAQAEGDRQKIVRYTKKSFDYTLIFSIMFFNIIFANTITFVPWFFGNDFIKMTSNMLLVSLIIILSPLGGIFSNQFSIAIENDRAFAYPLITGAFISVIGNVLIVPKYGAIGGTIVLVFVEFSIFLMKVFLVRKELDLKLIFDKSVVVFTVISIFISLISFFLLPNHLGPPFVNMVWKSLLIFLVYLIVACVTFPDLRQLLGKFFKRGA
ncbi:MULTISPECIES: oligosaccharide flippase family protein [Enterococcus]|uniref:Oligosaccharide flippase family protein n=1 Tax=Enterococcus alishanensis TaxID=1303817 RepID=A0ABS6TAD4_9ENTE|nr:oligosaccharide flippase family protein [Enterococcus alishanensis]MBV7389863.1 oligosaccharide flippase family protein [Enterococcus alishanensis]